MCLSKITVIMYTLQYALAHLDFNIKRYGKNINKSLPVAKIHKLQFPY